MTGTSLVKTRTLVWLGAATVLALAAAAAGLGPRVFAAALGAAALPLPVYLAAALWFDRLEPEPRGMLAMAFLYGASVAVVMAGLVNGVMDARFGEYASSTITAPVVEELLKSLILFRFYRRKKSEFDGVVDGLIYAAMVGLGFAFTENIDYYGRALAKDGLNGLAVTFTLRGVMSPFSHPLFTAATGVGLGLARQTHRRWARRVAPPAGLAIAIALHSAWNAGASMGCVFFAVYGAVMVPAMVALLVVAGLSVRSEGRVVLAYLAGDRDRGLLSDAEYRTLSSVRGRLHASVTTLMRRGWGAWRRRAAFHVAASELAFHRHRVADGEEPADEALEAAWAARATEFLANG